MVSEVYGRDIVFPRKFQVEASEDKSFAKITLSPLQQGFGITIGNILRRTLLSSIRGVAIDNIKISDAQHEYTTIDGVKQNVSDIIHNLRRVIFTTELEKATLNLSVKGPRKVYASDIKTHTDIKILNQDFFLFEITTDRTIDVEINLCSGIGDIFISQNEKQSLEHITLDKHFSPVLNVNTSVSQVRLDNRTDYDKLVLEVKTNGSIDAEEAFKVSVSILTNFLLAIDDAQQKMFTSIDETKKNVLAENPEFNFNLLKEIDELELSVRSQNCLKQDGIKYVGDLVNKNENDMLRTPNFGRKSLNEIKQILSDMGLSFGMNIEWPPKNMQELLIEAKNN